MLKQFKASMMDKNNEHQLDKNQKKKKKKSQTITQEIISKD